MIGRQRHLSLGASLALLGASMAVAHANAVASTPPKLWGDEAYEHLLRFIDLGLPFMAEDVRLDAESKGFSAPPDGRAWGAVVKRAVREGLIKRIGFEPMKSPNCHNNPKSVWLKK